MVTILTMMMWCFPTDGDTPRHDRIMLIDFIALEGCPNTPPMLASLKAAIARLRIKATITIYDVQELADKADVRSGFGAPTIIIDGKDLFGAPLPDHSGVSCRFYRPEPPGVREITRNLRRLLKRG